MSNVETKYTCSIEAINIIIQGSCILVHSTCFLQVIIGFAIGVLNELSNLYCHVILSNLRPPGSRVGLPLHTPINILNVFAYLYLYGMIYTRRFRRDCHNFFSFIYHQHPPRIIRP